MTSSHHPHRLRRARRLALGAALALLSITFIGPAHAGPFDFEQPTVVLSLDKQVVATGEDVTLTATVDATKGSPAGQITFSSAGDPLDTIGPVDLEPVAGNAFETTAHVTTSFKGGTTYELIATYTPVDDGTFSFVGAVSSPVALTVSSTIPHRTTTTLGIDPLPIVQGATETLTASVSSDDGSIPTGAVYFYDGVSTLGSAQLVDGVATLGHVGSFGAGHHEVYASYQGNAEERTSPGDPLFDPSSSAVNRLDVADTSPRETTTYTQLTVSRSTIHVGDTVDLTATVTQDGQQVVPAGGVTFYSNSDCSNGVLGSADVGADGTATIHGVGSWAAQGYTLCASYVGDTFKSSRGTARLQVVPQGSPTTIDTRLSLVGPGGGDFGDPVTLTAHLADASGAPVANAPVSFTLGTQSCTGGVTNTDGDVACTLTPLQAAGDVTLAAHYDGDGVLLPSEATRTFTIAREETTLSLAAPPAARQGSSVTLTATLLEDGTAAVADGHSVTFTYGGQTCTGTTSAGIATCAFAAGALGPASARATFVQDGYYFAAAAQPRTLYVYGETPGGGSFVVGDGSATAGVSFWGNQWSRENTLSGGPAPSAFKGYALHGTTACGGAWSTDPGNSTPPPASLPSYIAVIVAGSADRTKAGIAGTAAHVVVVRTAGYDANPGHAAGGTVVATLC